jgi:hypothetical protein
VEISLHMMEMVTAVGRLRPCPRCTGIDDWDGE